MSGMIETEMSDCLEQMAKLQEKMERLQEEKNKQAAEEVVKQNSTEPNLQVMSDWLDKYGEILEEIERERVIEEQYRKLESQRDNGLENKIIKYEKIINFDKDLDLPIKRFRHEIGRKIGHDIHSKEEIEQLRIKYEPTPEEYELYKNKDLITEKYMNLENKRRLREKTKYYGNNGKIVSLQKEKYEKIRSSPFHNPIGNTPTYFMKQYIEATYNMFLIQQKQIDELERKLNDG